MPWQDRAKVLGLLLPVIVLLDFAGAGAFCLLAQALGLRITWLGVPFGVASGVAIGVAWGVLFGVGGGVLQRIAGGVARRMGVLAWGVAVGVAGAATMGVVLGVAAGTTPGFAWDTVMAVAGGAAVGVAMGVAMGAAMSVAWGVAVGVAWGLAWGVTAGADTGPAWGVAGGACCFLGYLRVEWYGLDAAATLWQLARARRHPERSLALFRRSPIYWREPIWLPLPGLKSFLRLVAEQGYQAGAAECLFVMLERPTKAAAARAALLEIAAERLARVNGVPDIPTAIDDVPWLRGRVDVGSLVEPWVTSSVVIAELGAHAAQYLTATLPHNRRAALKRLQVGARGLAGRLGLTSGRVVPDLVRAMRKWEDLARTALEDMGREEEAAGWVSNPFVFGQPIEETETNLFVGRRDIVREIEISLLGGTPKPALVLWGPRRMGKTSVLMQLPRLLGPAFAPAFVDMQAMQARESVPAFLQSLTQQAEVALRRRQLAIDTLKLSDLNDNPFSVFAEWLRKVEGELGQERYLLLCLDEYERLEQSILEGGLPRDLIDQLRHIIQHHQRIVLLLAGSHRPDQMRLNWADVLISSRLVRVSYLREEEARQLITEPVPRFGIAYAAGSVERVIDVTRCQPNLVQAVCYELVNHLNVEGRREALSKDVDIAVERTFDSAFLYFADLWGQLTGRQQSLLHAISQATAGLDDDDVAQAVDTEQSAVAADLRTLEQRSILEHSNGVWRFQVPMARGWVRTRAYE